MIATRTSAALLALVGLAACTTFDPLSQP